MQARLDVNKQLPTTLSLLSSLIELPAASTHANEAKAGSDRRREMAVGTCSSQITAGSSPFEALLPDLGHQGCVSCQHASAWPLTDAKFHGVQEDKFAAFEAKMKAAGANDASIAAFKKNFQQLMAGVTGMVGIANSIHLRRFHLFPFFGAEPPPT